MVSAISYNNIKKEILNELRNADLISVSDRDVTRVVETHDGDNSSVNFILSNTGVKNIKTVTIGGVPQVFGTDYNFSEAASVTTVVFTSAPASGTDNISITYDYGTGDKIYPDFPLAEVNISNYPRIGFDIINSNSTEMAIAGEATVTAVTISIVAYGTGTTNTEEMVNGIRSLFINKKTSLYYINFIRPLFEGPMISVEGAKNKVFQRNLDFELPFEYEI